VIFANYLEYGDRDKVLELRPSHQKYLFDLMDQGKVVAAGSFPDDVGGLYLYEADTEKSAEKLMLEDPYVLGGAIQSYRILAWEVHGAKPALLKVSNKASGANA
jgi:uncharacterized protein